MASGPDATQLLKRLCEGDPRAREEFAPILHAELRKLAQRHLGNERANHTLNPTELVHDAWIRLIRPEAGHWENRRQFYALASRVMRSLLVDHARRRGAQRRGGAARDITLSVDVAPAESSPSTDVLVLDDALRRLEEIDEQLGRIAEMRLFGGVDMADVAEHFGLQLRTAERRWKSARVWLKKALADD